MKKQKELLPSKARILLVALNLHRERLNNPLHTWNPSGYNSRSYAQKKVAWLESIETYLVERSKIYLK